MSATEGVVLTESRLREILRQEIRRALPEIRSAPQFLTIRECATRFKLGYSTVAGMVLRGELVTTERVKGKNGRKQQMVSTADAEAKLGPVHE